MLARHLIYVFLASLSGLVTATPASARPPLEAPAVPTLASPQPGSINSARAMGDRISLLPRIQLGPAGQASGGLSLCLGF